MCVYAQTEASSCSCDYGRSYVYRVDRAPLCDYMVSFIHKLRSLPENYMMNSVLENFTVLQVHTFAVLAIKTSGGGAVLASSYCPTHHSRGFPLRILSLARYKV